MASVNAKPSPEGLNTIRKRKIAFIICLLIYQQWTYMGKNCHILSVASKRLIFPKMLIFSNFALFSMNGIGHFLVAFCLCVKRSLHRNQFIWKCISPQVLFHANQTNFDKWIGDLDKVLIMEKRSQVEILRKKNFHNNSEKPWVVRSAVITKHPLKRFSDTYLLFVFFKNIVGIITAKFKLVISDTWSTETTN